MLIHVHVPTSCRYKALLKPREKFKLYFLPWNPEIKAQQVDKKHEQLKQSTQNKIN